MPSSTLEDNGKTLMQTAVELNKPKFVKILLKKSVDPNYTNGSQKEPVLLAAEGGRHEILELFRRHTSRPDCSNPVNFVVWDKRTHQVGQGQWPCKYFLDNSKLPLIRGFKT